MVELLTSPWVDTFDRLVRNCCRSLTLCAPFVSRGACDRLLTGLRTAGGPGPVSVSLLTDLSAANVISGATDPAAILAVMDAVPGFHLRYLPRLHAKVYVADTARAIITSGNLTEGGLHRNHEYGVELTDPALVARVHRDVTALGRLGCHVGPDRLRPLAAEAAALRAAYTAAERTRRAEAAKELADRLAAVADQLLLARVAGRSPTATFAEAVLFLLRNGPMTTPDIHTEVQRLHPDLCDDSVDRVISGRRFGKKWKHAVRSAQAQLKRRGQIAMLDGNRWVLADSLNQ